MPGPVIATVSGTFITFITSRTSLMMGWITQLTCRFEQQYDNCVQMAHAQLQVMESVCDMCCMMVNVTLHPQPCWLTVRACMQTCKSLACKLFVTDLTEIRSLRLSIEALATIQHVVLHKIKSVLHALWCNWVHHTQCMQNRL